MEPLSKILSRMNIPGPGPLQLQRIQETASTVLGDGAREIRVGPFRSGRLTLEVASAAQSFEWGAFRSQELIAELRKVSGLEGLQEIRFRVGSWRKNFHE